jgi:type II secretory pathway pseudopilin PulG
MRTEATDAPRFGPACPQSAFTLIEAMGVVAVIAVLAAVLAPSVIRRVDRAASTRETAELQAIADSYTQYVLRTKTVPGPNTWASVVASEMSVPVSTIATNMRRYARVFLIDTNLNINGSGLPYTQTTNGTTAKPANARLLFVSALAGALPIASGVPSGAEFNAIWNTAEGAKPSTWTSWAGSGDDLRIKRLNLEPLFHRLILVNRDINNPAFFSIESTNTMAVPTNPRGLGWDRYYLDGTIVTLNATNGVVASRYRLKRSMSLVFDSSAWPDEESPSGPAYSGQGAEFVNHVLGFSSAPLNPYAGKGGTQIGIIIGMYTFMFDYALWAKPWDECPHFPWHGQSGSNPQGVPEYDMLDKNRGNIDAFSKALIAVPNN